jgi:outer membrane protein insertion porin family
MRSNSFSKMSQGYNTLRHLLALLLFASLTFHHSALSQKPAAETYKILGVSVEGNNAKSGTETGAIITNSGLRVGDQISVPGDQVHHAIQRLWALRIFSDIQILIENKVEDGVYLLIKVKEFPRFDHVEVKGADDVSEDDVKKKVTLIKSQIITPEDLNKVIKSIKKLYEDEGHLLADVKSDTLEEDSTKQNYVTLRLTINEGPSVQLDKVHFNGNVAFSEDDLKGQFDDTKEKTWWHFWSHPKLDKKKFEADKDRLIKFYRKNGYLDAEVTSDSTWYSQDKKKISVLVTVHEGVQYKVRNITWEGNSVYTADQLNQRLQFVPGQVFDEEKFEQNLRGNQEQNDVAALYLDNGYLKFNLDPDIRRVLCDSTKTQLASTDNSLKPLVKNGCDSLDITIHVYERNQFRIGQVEIKGNRKTHDNVIRRELFTRPGDYFDRSAIFRSLRQLSQLNYFNPEKLRPDTRLVNDETVDLSYEVEEKSSDNVNASVGYSGAFGVTGALGFTINNFSITEPLSGGAGQILNFDWQFGEGARFRTFSLGFTEPWLYNTPTTLGVSLYDTRQVFVYDLQQTGLSVRVGRGRLSWLDVYSRLDYTFRFQSNDVHDNGGNPLYRVGKTTQFSISQTLSRNSTDSPIFPSTGSNISFMVEVAGGPFLPGNVDYHKWLLSAEWYTPLFGTNRVVLYTSTTLGYIDGFHDDSQIPPIEYFYMGGTGVGYIATTPLRGYEDRQVGPRNNSGEIGGRVLDKHTAELRLAVALSPIPIYILGFAEGGNVFTDYRHTDFFDLKRSYGFGARLLIQPIGMIGFDYGYGADDVYPKDGKPDGWKFHFQFGRGF